MKLPGRARGRGAPVDWLIVGLGNPGAEYKGSPHNIGFEVAQRLNERWGLGTPKSRYRGLITEGRTGIGPGHARVAILMPQTYMNEAGRSVGPMGAPAACTSAVRRAPYSSRRLPGQG